LLRHRRQDDANDDDHLRLSVCRTRRLRDRQRRQNPTSTAAITASGRRKSDDNMRRVWSRHVGRVTVQVRRCLGVALLATSGRRHRKSRDVRRFLGVALLATSGRRHRKSRDVRRCLGVALLATSGRRHRKSRDVRRCLGVTLLATSGRRHRKSRDVHGDDDVGGIWSACRVASTV